MEDKLPLIWAKVVDNYIVIILCADADGGRNCKFLAFNNAWGKAAIINAVDNIFEQGQALWRCEIGIHEVGNLSNTSCFHKQVEAIERK